MCKRIIGIDPGNLICGVAILEDGILSAFNLENSLLWHKLTSFLIHQDCIVVVEDIRPYSLKLSPQVVATCKFIGELVYRLRNEAGATVELISRYEVKKWVFDQFPEVSMPLIEKKIDKKVFLACDIKSKELITVDTNGKGRRKASFIFVDDRIVTEAMKSLYKIPLPPPGQGYQYGLKEHSWQALACASYFKNVRLPLALP